MLEQSLGALEGAFRTRDIERYARGAIELHNRVLAAARNQVLSRELENVYAQIHLLRLRSLHLPERLDTNFDEHRCIVGAVIAGEADQAEAVSRQHAARVLEDALAAVRKAGS